MPIIHVRAKVQLGQSDALEQVSHGLPAELRRVQSSPARPFRKSSASAWSLKRMPQLHSAPTLRRCFGGSTTRSSLCQAAGMLLSTTLLFQSLLSNSEPSASRQDTRTVTAAIQAGRMQTTAALLESPNTEATSLVMVLLLPCHAWPGV